MRPRRTFQLLVRLLAVVGVSAARAATISIVAVRVNDTPIEPSSSIHVQPGDRVESELHLSDWGASFSHGLTGYRATISMSMESPLGGSIVPAGWTDKDFRSEGCLEDEHCEASADCCWGRCLSPRPLGISIDRDRPDFIFQGRESNVEEFPNCGDEQLAGAITEGSGVLDPGAPRYLATARFEVSSDACGVFGVSLGPALATFLFGDNPDPVSTQPTKVGLRMIVPDCGPSLDSCQPENCMIDPRIPGCLDPSQGCGRIIWNELYVMGFSEPMVGVTAAFFRVFISPDDDDTPVPGFTSITTVQNDVHLLLNRTTPVVHWTCVEYRVRGQTCCFGKLPGDVDLSRRSQPTDTFALLDHLKETELLPYGLLQCDIDRSTLCTPADLLMEVDLLTGRGSWPVWNDAHLPECPSLP